MTKEKIIILLIIIIMFFVNPKTMKSIKSYLNNDKIKVIQELDIDSHEKEHIFNYDNKLIMYDGKHLKALDEKGQKIFDINIEINNFKIASSKYIDILDEKNKIGYSINKNGDVIFKNQFRRIPISFKSIDNKTFIYHYKHEKNEYIDLYDINKNKIKTILIHGTITDIDILENNIVLTYLNTEEELLSTINKYNTKGRLIESNKFKNKMFIETSFINNKFYCVDTDSISILKNNLKLENNINIKGNIKFIGNTSKYITLIDSENNIINIDNKLESKKKNSVKDIRGMSYYDNSLIIYNDKEIKNLISNNDYNFDSKIYNIINISDNTIAILQNKKVSLLYIN